MFSRIVSALVDGFPASISTHVIVLRPSASNTFSLIRRDVVAFIFAWGVSTSVICLDSKFLSGNNGGEGATIWPFPLPILGPHPDGEEDGNYQRTSG